MNTLMLAILIAFAFYALRAREQGQRIALLAQHLRRYQIEQLMERLTEGYQRVLDESDLQRRDQLWQQFGASETALAEQVGRLAQDFSRLDASQTRVSRLPLPFAARWLPQACFDMRDLLALHAQGLTEVVRNSVQRSPQERAYTLLAELLLLQHSCHWFCRARAVASARLLARHQTRHAQVLASVSAPTRTAYCRLVGT
ncbi:MAG: hypothetical protein RJA36_254 [Pseudomonadota bacterium]|jgi:hypothetical protein